MAQQMHSLSGALLALEDNRMYGLDQDCRQLCEAASREKDPKKLLEYVERLNHLLAERETRGSQDTVTDLSLTTGPVLTAA